MPDTVKATLLLEHDLEGAKMAHDDPADPLRLDTVLGDTVQRHRARHQVCTLFLTCADIYVPHLIQGEVGVLSWATHSDDCGTLLYHLTRKGHLVGDSDFRQVLVQTPAEAAFRHLLEEALQEDEIDAREMVQRLLASAKRLYKPGHHPLVRHL